MCCCGLACNAQSDGDVRQTYFVLDILCWNGAAVLDSDTEFRQASSTWFWREGPQGGGGQGGGYRHQARLKGDTRGGREDMKEGHEGGQGEILPM